MPNKGDLQIWHNADFGNKSFERPVKTVEEAIDKLRLIADYDLYLGERRVSDNAQSLAEWDGEEWCEWWDDEGRTIHEYAEWLEEQEE